MYEQSLKEQGPPDLDQLLKKFFQKLKNNFNSNKSKPNFSGNGGSNGSNGSGSASGPSLPKEWNFIAVIIGAAILFLYLISGIYIVDPPERAVITRFGKYVATKGPGPHWLAPLIESKEIVNVEQVHTSDLSGLMLTKDRNIASVGIAVQYRIGNEEGDVRTYLFNTVNPVLSLKLSAESALRQVVGQSTMDEVLTQKRSEIATAIKEQIIETMKLYNTGVRVLDVAMQFAKAPDEVRAAFDDVIKAAADEERLVNQARAYENEVLPQAKATVERLKNEALSYQQETVLRSQGNVQRFNKILPEYKKAPKVTQTRLYLDTMEEVLSKTTKMVVENGGNGGQGGNLIYLPLDKLVPKASTVSESEAASSNTTYQNNGKEKNS